MSRRVGNRAIVLGASMAGLLAARVLSESFDEVLLFDRDTLTGVTTSRPSVPHGRHAHGLVARGQQILEQQFPGLTAELARDGVQSGDFGADIRWYFNGKLLQTEETGLLSVPATRPVLEHHVRTRVMALPNVAVSERHDILGLLTDEAHQRVTGVRVRSQAEGSVDQELVADLVLDTTGRGSRTTAWLVELGYQRPEQEKIKVGLAYTTRHFKLDHDPFGKDLAIIPVATPDFPRGALMYRLPGGDNRVELSLTGVCGDHPPIDHEGFLAFARSLPVPDIYEAIKDADPLDDPVKFSFPASVRNRYENLKRFPEGLLVLGDAVCSFNPVYGQGMTVAALESLSLQRLLQAGSIPTAQEFFRLIAKDIDDPWQFAAGADLSYPEVDGPRSVKVRIANAYMTKLHRGATKDARLTTAFIRAAGLIDSPQSLMRPVNIWRVLRSGRGSRADQPAPVPRIPYDSMVTHERS
jgi:2-polyprenyl-6-methoxyphenol hydroxylase-like FAD-dependent oxidoreductase